MKISITLPSLYPDALARTLKNIRNTTSVDYEIIVVSPFKVDETDVIWIEEKERNGSAFAHAVASSRATGNFITATSDDCEYLPGWDIQAIANFSARKPKDGSMFCLGLHFGLIGTVYGIYYCNFPFMRLEDALSIGYFDGRFKKDFTDTDLSFKVWSKGGRCEYSKKKLINITKADIRKGGENCLDEDLDLFAKKWGAIYGQGFKASSMRCINIDFDPDHHPEFVQDYSVYNNEIEVISKLHRISPPHLVKSINSFNIVSFKGKFLNVPFSLGSIDLDMIDALNHDEITVFDTLQSASKAVEQYIPLPCLIKSINQVNIVLYNRKYYNIPFSLGSIDLQHHTLTHADQILVFDSLVDACFAASKI
ncbi:hypothetical protein NP590_00095 [Methylomonas sp. SURF-2]|uniref:Glycosyltransferase 2-like domain-containing protein n=1 Tax=Methylomonas subterranea TaxID=2952225 RepID=A0ABT1TAL7_9GAMM|nr:hypothetical protein [Methylomonas sp. SURF-2]MCQ8102486.1 hypothetical protein [Methylomonas sp. SURF-2]